jgi:hypothetical protein
VNRTITVSHNRSHDQQRRRLPCNLVVLPGLTVIFFSSHEHKSSSLTKTKAPSVVLLTRNQDPTIDRSSETTTIPTTATKDDRDPFDLDTGGNQKRKLQIETCRRIPPSAVQEEQGEEGVTNAAAAAAVLAASFDAFLVLLEQHNERGGENDAVAAGWLYLSMVEWANRFVATAARFEVSDDSNRVLNRLWEAADFEVPDGPDAWIVRLREGAIEFEFYDKVLLMISRVCFGAYLLETGGFELDGRSHRLVDAYMQYTSTHETTDRVLAEIANEWINRLPDPASASERIDRSQEAAGPLERVAGVDAPVRDGTGTQGHGQRPNNSITPLAQSVVLLHPAFQQLGSPGGNMSPDEQNALMADLHSRLREAAARFLPAHVVDARGNDLAEQGYALEVQVSGETDSHSQLRENTERLLGHCAIGGNHCCIRGTK